MNKLAFVILFLAFPISYALIHFLGLKLIGDYAFVFMICIGVALLSFIESQFQHNKILKYLFYRAICIFNSLIVLMYLIDLIADPLFKTGKVIWSIIITTFISLCVYLYKRHKH